MNKICKFSLLILCGTLLAGSVNAVELQQGLLLVAKEGMKDPRFRHHSILLIQHGARGSAGLVLDRESRLPLASVLGEESILAEDKMLAYGGPVEPETLLALVEVREHPPEPSDHVMDNLYVTGAYVLEDWPDFPEETVDYRVFAGYTGWAQGQLQAEVDKGAWQLLEADIDVVFPPAGPRPEPAE